MHSLQKTHFQTQKDEGFARLFPELPAFEVSDSALESLADRMVDNNNKGDSKSISNGIGIFGQFLAHDCTFETSSRLKGTPDPSSFVNHRTYQFDLDCLYGQWTQDFFYDAEDRSKLLLGDRYEDECNRVWYDLQRNAQNKAIIPDARNDENIIVSRMHVLFIDLHNCMVDWVRNNCQGHLNEFQEARKMTTWIYHWLIVHEYLAKMLDPEVFEDLKCHGPRYYHHPWYMPLEFTGAAFRVGHSQTRNKNRINVDVEKGLFELGVFNRMEYYVDWSYLFDLGDMKVQPAMQIDTKLPKAFHNLPFVKADKARLKSLPWRNLKRGVVYGLPCGEDVARRLGLEPLAIAETKSMGGTPLWYYILKEAEVEAKGEHLGKVGSILLGEVFFGLMLNDNGSYLKVFPNWQPPWHSEKMPFDFGALVRLLYNL